MPRPETLQDDLAAAESLDKASSIGNLAVAALAPTMLRKKAGHSASAAAAMLANMEPVQGASSPKTWTLAAWLESEGIAQLIAQALIGEQLATIEGPDRGDEMWAVRELVSEHSGHLDKEVRKKLAEQIRNIGEYLAPKLKRAAAIMDAPTQLGDDAQEKFVVSDSIAMKHESLVAFHCGLQGKIGLPQANVHAGVEEEHMLCDDSSSEFGSGHYEITTTSQAEWRFVFEPEVCPLVSIHRPLGPVPSLLWPLCFLPCLLTQRSVD